MVVVEKKPENAFVAALITFYLFFTFIVLPLLSPMRNLGILDPAYIRNALLPLLLLLVVLTVGVGGLLRPVASVQILFLFMFSQGALVGGVKLFEEYSFRHYASHLFQIASAYVLVKSGWLLYRHWDEHYWRKIVIFVLISTFASSAITIVALGRGDIARYYTAAYGFILISAFAVVASKKIFILSFIGALISNKRAVLIAVVVMFFAKPFSRGVAVKNNIVAILSKFALLFVSSLLLFGVCYALLSWSEVNKEHALAKAVNISAERFERFFIDADIEQTLEMLSSGRIEEINATVEVLDWMDILIGSGAGWSVTLEGGEENKIVQNIHFTPLSLVAVYGVPIASVFYLILLVKLFIGLRIYKGQLGIMEKMAPLYVLGGFVHSFFAYSLFVDWMFFFFFGVMLRSISNDRKRSRGVAL